LRFATAGKRREGKGERFGWLMPEDMDARTPTVIVLFLDIARHSA
jgi:hypothetical protein